MIENVRSQALVVGAGQKGVAGAQAGSQNPELTVALLRQPIEAAADVNHRLAARIDRSADIGADGVIGALQLAWPADIVIRHAQPQRRNAKPVEGAAERVVADGV